MDEAAARAALGVGPTAPWSEVRAAYRSAIQAAHPDRAGGSTQAAAHLNAAYAVLLETSRTRVRSTAETATNAPRSVVVEPPEPVTGAVIATGDTLVLPVPPDEAFAAVLEACHRVGDVTYVDRQCAIVEALLQIAGEGTCSLVTTFQGRAHGTDVFCTLEAIEHVASPPVAAVVRELGEVVTSVLGGS